jgi:hypothetical protein
MLEINIQETRWGNNNGQSSFLFFIVFFLMKGMKILMRSTFYFGNLILHNVFMFTDRDQKP